MLPAMAASLVPFWCVTGLKQRKAMCIGRLMCSKLKTPP
jgi:hypothetical protein